MYFLEDFCHLLRRKITTTPMWDTANVMDTAFIIYKPRTVLYGSMGEIGLRIMIARLNEKYPPNANSGKHNKQL